MIINPVLPLFILLPSILLIIVAGAFAFIKKSSRNLATLRRLLMVLLLCIALLRPTITGGKSRQVSTGVTVFFAIDNTNSMATKDVDGNSRLSALKKDVRTILKSFLGSHYSIFVQDAFTYNIVPSTTDLNAVASTIDNMQTRPRNLANQTNLNDLLSQVDGKIKTYSKDHPESQNVVIIMSDGENTADEGANAQKGLFKDVAVGAVIGYGTAEGGRVPAYIYEKIIETDGLKRPANFIYNYLQDGCYGDLLSVCSEEDADLHKSKIDESFLTNIASEYGFGYTHSTGELDSSWTEKLKKNVVVETTEDKASSVASDIELYWLFALVALALLLWDFSNSLDLLLSEQEVKK